MSRIKEFNLPDLGEGLTEGEILKWLVNVGDTIELNQPIVEVETAKAAVEIPAKWAGQVASDLPPGGHHGRGRHADHRDRHRPGRRPPTRRRRLPRRRPAPSAASLAAVEVAPAEGTVEPGLIGGPAPGGRTAVLVGYGPRTTAAKRRPRKGAGPGAGRAGSRAGRADCRQPVAAPAVGAGADGPAATVPAGVLAKPPVRKLARDLGRRPGHADRHRARRARSPGRTCSRRRRCRRRRTPTPSRRTTAPRLRAGPRAAHPGQGRAQADRREHGRRRRSPRRTSPSS